MKAPEQTDYVERLAEKDAVARGEAQAMIDRMVEFGRASGVEMRFDRIRPSSTLDAHRLLAWARERGRQTELKERLFSAYLHEGLSVSDREVLASLAADVGLDGAEAQEALSGEDHLEEVRADEQLAARIGARAVPFFVLDNRLAVSGAQPAEILREAMERATEGLE
jgi:predicted DsbA family dithiol-disulfide isomerase